jgi:hypothetical protein
MIGDGQVYVGLSKLAHDPLDFGIKFCTHATVGHALFVRGNGKIAENFFPHVHERDWNPGELAKTEIYSIQDSTPADWARLERWIDWELLNQKKISYSILDLFRYAFNMPPAKGEGCFCSQWVLRGIRMNLADSKQPLVRLEYQDFGSPMTLRISPRLIRVS